MTSRILTYTLAGIPVKTILSYSFTAAVSGLACGKCYRNIKEHPGTGHKILKFSIAGGFAGGLIGMSVGLWVGRNALMLSLTQTMYGYIVAGTFFNIRSVASNEKFTLPKRSEPIGELLLSSLSGGITGIIPPLLFKFHPSFILAGCTTGIIFGFLGHISYDYLCYKRLEYLLRQNHPDLVRQHKEAEEYMIDRQKTDYFYTGPIKGNPEWMDRATTWFHKMKQRKYENSTVEL